MTALTDPAALAAEFTVLNPPGTPVHYWLNVRHGEPHTGTIAAPAQPRSAHYNRPVVLVADDTGRDRTVPLNLVEPIGAKVVDPCDICRHPKAGHGIRYKALHGDHEWRDPYGRLITDIAPKPTTAQEPATGCTCAPTEYCPQCDPWHDAPPAAPAVTSQAAPPAPGPFARIANAARRAT
jgi:hypothetical protein